LHQSQIPENERRGLSVRLNKQQLVLWGTKKVNRSKRTWVEDRRIPQESRGYISRGGGHMAHIPEKQRPVIPFVFRVRCLTTYVNYSPTTKGTRIATRILVPRRFSLHLPPLGCGMGPIAEWTGKNHSGAHCDSAPVSVGWQGVRWAPSRIIEYEGHIMCLLLNAPED
jgi:hypothetical protein